MSPTQVEVSAADTWWAEQPDVRRVQICRWITQRSGLHIEVPGQIDLLEGIDDVRSE